MGRGIKLKMWKLTDCGARFVQLGQHTIILLDFGHDAFNVAAVARWRYTVTVARQFRHGSDRYDRLWKAFAQVVI